MKNFTLAVAFLLIVAFGASAQTTIYSQNFSSANLPAGWQNIDKTNGGNWSRKTSARNFASSTRSNGFYIFDSDVLGNDGKAEDADLISGAIDCSGQIFVALQFEHYFEQYVNSEGAVSVSTDGNVWTEVFVVNQSTDNPEIVTLNISSIAANQPTVYLKFNYIGNYDLFWAIDDIKMFVPPAYDIALETLDVPRYTGLKDQPLSGKIKNYGYLPVSSVDLSYSVNGGATVNQQLNNLNIAPFETISFEFDQKLQMQTPLTYSVTVNANSPSGAADMIMTNNSITKDIVALSAIAEKKVLIEQFTTAQCVFCPDGFPRIQDITTNYNYAIPVALHAGFGTDAMTTPEAEDYVAEYIDGAPSATIDRVLFKDETILGTPRILWKDYTILRHGQTSPATVAASSTFNPTTRELVVSVTSKFFAPISGDFRLNVFLVEDSVIGSGSGYNQANAMNNQPGHPYQGKGNPIVGMPHRYVERKALGGTWGKSGVIANPTTNEGEYTTTFSYTIPNSIDASKSSLVAFVHEYNNNFKSGKNEVLNAVALPLNGSNYLNSTPSVYTNINSPESAVIRLSVYPNPANDVVYLDYIMNGDAATSFEIYDMMGKLVSSIPTMEQSAGNYTVSVATNNFTNGVYFVVAKNNNQTAGSIKFVINR